MSGIRYLVGRDHGGIAMGQTIGGVIGTVTRLWSRGIVGVIAAGLAVLACYGLLALTALLPLFGVRLALDATAWAAVIVVFTLLTMLAVIPGFRCHGSVLPAGTAIAGSGLILYALLVEYGALTELAGFALLITAVSTDAFLRRRTIGAAGGGTAGRRPGHNRNGCAAQRSDGGQIS